MLKLMKWGDDFLTDWRSGFAFGRGANMFPCSLGSIKMGVKHSYTTLYVKKCTSGRG
jgi:hypothetical protein